MPSSPSGDIKITRSRSSSRRHWIVISLLLIVGIYVSLMFLTHFQKPSQPRVSRLFASLSGNKVWTAQWQIIRSQYSDDHDALEEDIERLADIDKIFADDELDNIVHESHVGFVSREENLNTKLDELYQQLNLLLDKQEYLYRTEKDVFKFQKKQAVTFELLDGYPDSDADDKTHPSDPKLLDTILKHASNHPRFIRENALAEVTDWRFEKVIHQMGVDTAIPDETKAWVQKWRTKHPDWIYMFWTAKSARAFVKDYYPSLLTAYESFSTPTERSEMFRYIALFAFGGVFAELDMEPLRSLEEVRDWASCVLPRKPDVETYVLHKGENTWANDYTVTSNAFIACRSHNPFLYYMISRTLLQAPAISQKPRHSNHEIPSHSASVMLSLGYAYYKRSLGSEKLKDKSIGVISPEFDWFMPAFDPENEKIALEKCQKMSKLTPIQRFICKSWADRYYENKPRTHSLTTRHWRQTQKRDVITETSDILQVVKDVLIWSDEVKMKHFVLRFK